MSRVFAVIVMVGFMAGLAWVIVPERAEAQPRDRAELQAQAVPPPGSGDGAHYSFHRIGDGFARLDLRTGDLAHCSWVATGWACRAMPEERKALEQEIARLRRQNAELKKALLSRGLDLPGGIMSDVPAAKAPDKSEKKADAPKLPDEAELDRAFSYLAKIWRRLIEMVVELQREMQRKS